MITEERLRQTFSEGGAQEIYQEVKAEGDFDGFARRFVFNPDYHIGTLAVATDARRPHRLGDAD